jgi:CheY-like chemotaxis protein
MLCWPRYGISDGKVWPCNFSPALAFGVATARGLPLRQTTFLKMRGVGGAMKSILFVDDHELLARMTCSLLQRSGYRAQYVVNARDALAKFAQEKFDIVVTDYRMEGMDGIELAELLHRQAPGLPIIIVSGYPAPEPSEAVSAWVEKQNMFPTLLEKIKLLLGDTAAGNSVTNP